MTIYYKIDWVILHVGAVPSRQTLQDSNISFEDITQISERILQVDDTRLQFQGWSIY